MIPTWLAVPCLVLSGLVLVHGAVSWVIRTRREERTLPVVQVDCSLCEEWGEAMLSTPEHERTLRRLLERHLSEAHAAQWLSALALRSGARALGLWSVRPNPSARPKEPAQ